MQKDTTLRLGIFGILFIIGSILGSVVIVWLSDTTLYNLENTIIQLQRSIETETIARPAFFSSLLRSMSLFILVYLSAQTKTKQFLIPLCFAIKGFTLSFSASIIINALGTQGIAWAIFAVGIPALISLPLLFIFFIHLRSSQSPTPQISIIAFIIFILSIIALYETVLLLPILRNFI